MALSNGLPKLAVMGNLASHPRQRPRQRRLTR
jgi:hypothetical protein